MKVRRQLARRVDSPRARRVIRHARSFEQRMGRFGYVLVRVLPLEGLAVVNGPTEAVPERPAIEGGA